MKTRVDFLKMICFIQNWVRLFCWICRLTMVHFLSLWYLKNIFSPAFWTVERCWPPFWCWLAIFNHLLRTPALSKSKAFEVAYLMFSVFSILSSTRSVHRRSFLGENFGIYPIWQLSFSCLFFDGYCSSLLLFFVKQDARWPAGYFPSELFK